MDRKNHPAEQRPSNKSIQHTISISLKRTSHSKEIEITTFASDSDSSSSPPLKRDSNVMDPMSPVLAGTNPFRVKSPSTFFKERNRPKRDNNDFIDGLKSFFDSYRKAFPCQKFFSRVKDITDSKKNQEVKDPEVMYEAFKNCLDQISANKTKRFSGDNTQILLNDMFKQLGNSMGRAHYTDQAAISDIIYEEKEKNKQREWVPFKVVMDAFIGLVDELTQAE